MDPPQARLPLRPRRGAQPAEPGRRRRTPLKRWDAGPPRPEMSSQSHPRPRPLAPPPDPPALRSSKLNWGDKELAAGGRRGFSSGRREGSLRGEIGPPTAAAWATPPQARRAALPWCVSAHERKQTSGTQRGEERDRLGQGRVPQLLTAPAASTLGTWEKLTWPELRPTARPTT